MGLKGTSEATRENFPDMHAVLAGKPMPLAKMGDYSCTDTLMPRIYCFETAAELWATICA